MSSRRKNYCNKLRKKINNKGLIEKVSEQSTTLRLQRRRINTLAFNAIWIRPELANSRGFPSNCARKGKKKEGKEKRRVTKARYHFPEDANPRGLTRDQRASSLLRWKEKKEGREDRENSPGVLAIQARGRVTNLGSPRASDLGLGGGIFYPPTCTRELLLRNTFLRPAAADR